MAENKVNRPKYQYDQKKAMERNAKVPMYNYAAVNLPDIQRPVWMEPGYGSIFNPLMQAPAQAPAQAPTVPTNTPSTSEQPVTYNPTYGTVEPSNPWDAAEATGPAQQVQQVNFNPYKQQAFQWAQDVNGNWYLSGVAPGVPQSAAQGVPADWSSSYAPQYYQGQYLNPLNYLTGGSNIGSLGTRGYSSWLRRLSDRMQNVSQRGLARDQWGRWTQAAPTGQGRDGEQPASYSGAPTTWRT